MKIVKTIIIILMLNLTGCAVLNTSSISEEESAELKLYQLYINKDGNLLDPVSGDIVLDEDRYIDNIYKNFEDKKLKLTVFIHGGLNTFESATSRVRDVKSKMIKDDKYPLFISWSSGGFTNYSDHLFLIRDGEKTPVLGVLSSPFVFLEDALRSIARIPASTYNVLFGQNSVLVNNYTNEESASDSALAELEELGFVIYNSPNDTGHTFGDWWSVWNPVKLLSAPFVDGLGTGAWGSMLRRTDLVLRKDDGFNGNKDANTAVTKFFNKFSAEYKSNEIILIGHSMGTIIANNIIVRYPQLNFSNIVYMAAACKIKDLEYVVAPYLDNNPSSKFYNLSLNPYRDISENTYYDFAPRGSLLMWIDETLGEVNSFQDRTAGYWFNITRGGGEAFKHGNIRQRVNLTQFGIRDGSPQNHGEFSKYEFWHESFWKGDFKKL